MSLDDPFAATRPAASTDFDFIFGRWRVRHRRLKKRLCGCTEWEEFDGQLSAQRLLGGQGNVDDNLLELPSGHYRAAALRCFNPATRQWSIWWLDGRDPGLLESPMVGGFGGPIGTFLADDSLDGRPIHVRFLWTGTDTATPRWEQAFCADGGDLETHWETNWEMDFRR